MSVRLNPRTQGRLAVAAAVALTFAAAPVSAEGKAVMQAATFMQEAAAPLLQRLAAEACRVLLGSGAAWPANTGRGTAKAARSWT